MIFLLICVFFQRKSKCKIYVQHHVTANQKSAIQYSMQKLFLHQHQKKTNLFDSFYMQKLQISYLTWTRADANGLFDYEDLKDQKPDGKMMVERSGYLYRRRENYQLEFSSARMDGQKYEKILKLVRRDEHFMLYGLDIENEPLFKIIQKDYPKTHEIKKGDTIRFGKVVIQVLDIQFKPKSKLSPYQLIKQQIQNTKMTTIKEITPAFYGESQQQQQQQQQKQSANNKMSRQLQKSQKTSLTQSLYQQNPSCRYCYSKTVTQQNPFIVSCGCLGSARYIHEGCLLQWVLRRGELQQRNKSGVLFAEEKIFRCELCHQFFYVPDMWRKVFEKQKAARQNLEGRAFEEVLILHVKYQAGWLFFVDLGVARDVTIGRSLQNDMVLNELSVSRQHAILSIDSVEKVVTLSNNNAKFGTLVQIKQTEIQDAQNYQVGRSKIEFRKHVKRSFFDRVGLFCFANERIKNENVKSGRRSRVEMEEKEQPELKSE